MLSQPLGRCKTLMPNLRDAYAKHKLSRCEAYAFICALTAARPKRSGADENKFRKILRLLFGEVAGVALSAVDAGVGFVGRIR